MNNLVCGCDESGRGSAIGEIYAASVILGANHGIAGLRDSKKLTAQKRALLAQQIKAKALAWSVGTASLAEIEALNVLKAALLAMRRSIEGLSPQPETVYIDGLYVPPLANPGILAIAVVKGDDKIESVSASSIIAKVSRDTAMLEYDKLYPQYGIARHKGYLTRQHLAALDKYGPSPAHRLSYAPVKKCLLGR